MLRKLKCWDQSLLLWMQEHIRRTWLTCAMKTATFFGNGGILWIAICFFLMTRTKTRQAAVAALVSLVFSVLVNNAMLKNLVARTRPFDKIGDLIILIRRPQDFSFPSGHTSSSFAVATVFLCMLPFWAGLLTLTVASLIAFSRLYLGAHYPSDVLCGIVLGILFGLMAQRLLQLSLDGTWLPETARLWIGNGTI